jgi:Tol biopolymer transport system component
MRISNPDRRIKKELNATMSKMWNRHFVALLSASLLYTVVLLFSAMPCLVYAQPSLQAAPAPGMQPGTRTSVKVYDLKTGKIRVLYAADGFYEAPFWSRDGKYIYFAGGSNHKLFRMPASGGNPQLVDLGDILVNHDGGFSPDGKWHVQNIGPVLSISTSTGKERHELTDVPNSLYMHHWSPDSRWLTGTFRTPEDNYAVYRVSVEGGKNQRLTHSSAYDDGPDYSPDGKWIYFNSDRAGSFDIWRMPASGAGPDDKLSEQVTSDALQDWFPHPSPDGKWLLLLSYPANTGIKESMSQWLKDHPNETISHFNLAMHPYSANVVIRIRALPGDHVDAAPIKTLVELIGGQGSLNVNSWSPDSSQFAFTSYEAESK